MDKVFKALADPTRRGILQLLRERDMSAGELADHFGLAKPTMSGHFAVLKEAELVHVRRQGTTLIYCLNASLLQEVMLDFMSAFAPQPKERTAHD